MTAGTIVLDIGKTNAKVSLWDARGRLVDRWTRANVPRAASGYRALDVEGLEAWLMTSLASCARAGRVGRIIPVGHGAAAALVRGGRLFVPPMDYEDPIAGPERALYAAQRDAFADSGSPLLPGALNLGMQLHHVEALRGPLPDDVWILPWPQYWAWRLCGVMASEVTSLGCHTDLWRPIESRFSDLAARRGWAARMAPLRRADDVLGPISANLAAETGLPGDCEVLCGLHDSNAALLASRGHAEVAVPGSTIVSTGTWFVAMRALSPGERLDGDRLPEHRDCLLNVDARGCPVPSSRFMGGREAEIVRGTEVPPSAGQPPASEAGLTRILAGGSLAYPSFVPGVGPFPDAAGELPRNATPRERHAHASLYLALMTDTILTLIDSRGPVLVEGRFAADTLLVRALATLRPSAPVYTCDAENDLAHGALRLVAPELQPSSGLVRVEPLAIDLEAVADGWRSHAAEAQRAAETSEARA